MHNYNSNNSPSKAKLVPPMFEHGKFNIVKFIFPSINLGIHPLLSNSNK